MKKIVLLFTGLFICMFALGTTKTWTGASSTSPTDWGDPSNWSPSGVPTSTDDVEIPDLGLSGSYPVISSGESCNIMQLDQNATFTINSGAGSYLEINSNFLANGSGGNTVTVSGILRFAGSSGTFSGTAIISGTGSVEVQASYLLSVDGDLTVNTTFNHSGTIYVYGSRTMTVNGSFTASGSSTIYVGVNGNNSVFVTTGAFNYNSTGHISFNYGGIFSFGGTSTSLVISSNIIFDGSGVVDVASTRTLNLSGTLLDNTDFTHSGIINIYSTGTLTVNGTFTASGNAEIHVSTTGSGGLFVMGGNLAYNSSVAIDLQNNGILRFGGTGGGTFTRPVGGSATISGTGSVEIQASYLLSIDGDLTVNTTFNHSGTIYVYGSRTMTVNGSFTASGSSIIYIGVNGTNSSFVTTGAFNYNSTGHISFNYGGIFSFGGTSTSLVVSGNIIFDGSGVVDVASTRTLNLSGTLLDNTDFTHSGIINIYSTGTLTANGTFTASGNAEIHVSTTGSGGLFVMGGNLAYNSSVAIDLQNNGILRFGGTAGGTFTGTATISGTGSVEIQSSFSLYVDGNLTVNTPFNHSGALFVYADRTMTVNGSFTASGSSTIYVGINGNNSIFITTGDFTYNSSNAISLNYNAVFRFGGTSGSFKRTISGTATITNGYNASVEVTGGRTLYVDCELVINASLNNSGIIQINTGKDLTVSGNTSNSLAQGLVIKSDATGTGSFIDNGTISGTGTAKVERYLTGYSSSSDKKFHILSAPVGSFPIQPEFVNLPNSTDDFYKWDETINTWINSRDGSGVWNSSFESNFQEGRGYLVAYPSNLTKYFTGSLNTYPASSPKILNCTWTASGGGGGGGWNMLGNPFPSAIDWTLVTKGSAMDNALYYYDASIQNYRYYVQFLPGISVGGGSQYIPAMQGFFVHANNDAVPANQTITLDNSMRVHQSLATYYKDAEAPPGNYLVMKVDGNNFSDETYIYFYDQATPYFDRAYDAYKINSMNTDVPMIYTITPGDTNLAINLLPPASKNVPLPMGFKAPVDGSYTITASELNSFPPGVIITLEDRKTGITQNLIQNPVYAFTGNPSDDLKRFLLHFSGPIGIDEKKKDPTIQIYTSGDVIYVSSDKNLVNADVYIFNIIGQKIYSGPLNQQGSNPIRINGKTGYYIVKVVTGNEAVTAKVYL